MTQHRSLQERPVLGNSSGAQPFEGTEELRTLTLQMVTQARRQLSIFTLDLDAPVYDQPSFLEAVKGLVLNSPHARVEILLQDHDKAVKRGHRLIELARRLSSSIEMRRPNTEYLQHPENFLLVDRSGLIHRKLADRYRGVADFHAPLEARRLSEFFKTVWETSEPDHELRRLYL